jgi:hypothetical protein
VQARVRVSVSGLMLGILCTWGRAALASENATGADKPKAAVWATLDAGARYQSFLGLRTYGFHVGAGARTFVSPSNPWFVLEVGGAYRYACTSQGLATHALAARLVPGITLGFLSLGIGGEVEWLAVATRARWTGALALSAVATLQIGVPVSDDVHLRFGVSASAGLLGPNYRDGDSPLTLSLSGFAGVQWR